LKFPEEIPNEQSATPKRETLVGVTWFIYQKRLRADQIFLSNHQVYMTK